MYLSGGSGEGQYNSSRWELSRGAFVLDGNWPMGYCSRDNCPGENFLGGDCPGVNFPGG